MAGEQRAIAQALNLSEATVSRSLKNHPRISAATRARVAEAAVRMGFRGRAPRDAARADAPPGKATGLVHLGVLCRGSFEASNVHHLVSMRLIQGMSSAARVGRATLHVEYLTPSEFDKLDDISHWPPVLREHVVSGVAVFSDASPAAITALAREFALVRFIDDGRPLTDSAVEDRIDCVTEDNVRSMRQLITHLWELGHRKIGLADFGYTDPSTQARLAGYLQVLIERDLDYSPKDARYLPPNIVDLDAQLDHVAAHIASRAAHGVRAWICPNDYLGYRLIERLRAHRIQTPRDVSICGFDNFPAPHGLPKLTSIDGPFETMGAAATSQLLSRIINPHAEPVHAMYRCRLVVGGSTAPPRK